MDNYRTKIYQKEIYSEDIDTIFNQNSEDFSDAVFGNRDLVYDFKMYFRLIRKKFNKFFKETAGS